MIFELQKASVLKRVSAFILDLILLAVIATGAICAVSVITGYEEHHARLDGYYSEYAEKYGLDTFDITSEKYNSLSKEEKALYDEAYKALLSDEDVLRTYSMVVNLTMVMISLGIFFAYAILEFALPMILKNGQTVGKKVFGIGVMRVDGVKVSTFQLFVRTLLGKYTIGTMVPVMLVMMLATGSIGFVGALVIVLLALLQLIVMCVTKTNSTIHDLLAVTVVVDINTQMIFESQEKMIEYKKKKAAEAAELQPY